MQAGPGELATNFLLLRDLILKIDSVSPGSSWVAVIHDGVGLQRDDWPRMTSAVGDGTVRTLCRRLSEEGALAIGPEEHRRIDCGSFVAVSPEDVAAIAGVDEPVRDCYQPDELHETAIHAIHVMDSNLIEIYSREGRVIDEACAVLHRSGNFEGCIRRSG